jgi:hypothetical protein
MTLQTGTLTFGQIGTKAASPSTLIGVVRVPRPLSNILIGTTQQPQTGPSTLIGVVRVPRPLSNIILAKIPGDVTISVGSGPKQYWG